MKVSITPVKFAKLLTIITVTFVALGIITQILNWVVFNGEPAIGLREIFRQFDPNFRTNLPTTFKVVLWLLGAVFPFLIASAKRKSGEPSLYWYGLSLAFLYLAFDEGATIHQSAISLQKVLHTDGFFKYAWVIPALILVAIFAVVYAKFWWRLPSNIRTLVFVAAVMIVGGTAGGDILQGWISKTFNQGDNSFSIEITEALCGLVDMLGRIIFIYAMTIYIQTYMRGLSFGIAEKKSTPAPAQSQITREETVAIR